MIVYLAGGMRSDWRSEFSGLYVQIYNPMHHSFEDPYDYAFADLAAISLSDIVIGYMEKDNPSGLGLAFELGYALAMRKPTILINEQPDNRYFSFVAKSGVHVVGSIQDAKKMLEWLAI